MVPLSLEDARFRLERLQAISLLATLPFVTNALPTESHRLEREVDAY